MVTGRIDYKSMSHKFNKNNLDYHVKIVNNKMSDMLKVELTDEGFRYELKGIYFTTEDVHKLCDSCPYNRKCESGCVHDYDEKCYDNKYIPGLILSEIVDHLEHKANLCDIEDIIHLVQNPEDYTMPIFWYNNSGIEIRNAQNTSTCTFVKLDNDNHVIN